ncbi:Pyridoxal kinase [Micromonospora pattaloongensis]|uniref:pyridoxal kinase n=1 Tax=Micromonospora pattaloongensis TaxID=405436 RepID=A0A1H3JQF3_9ACTN|nr:Pyridoxal kinase [Micromonospora pattaloongensis]
MPVHPHDGDPGLRRETLIGASGPAGEWHHLPVKILSIQSSVAYGYVGNSAAVFPLQRLGHEVWPVLTVHFSNHTGYGAWRGPLLTPADVAEVIAGIEDRGVLADADAVLSGYQGDPAMGTVILDAVEKVKAANPDAVYCCDPVMGDVGRGMFVRPGIPEYMRDTVVPRADIVTPNQFELEFLSGRTTGSVTELLEAVDVVRAMGPRHVLVTSVLYRDAPEGSLDVVAVSDEGAWAVTTPLLPISPNGGGDVTAALYLAHLSTTGSPAAALERTTSAIFAVLEATLAAGTRELQLVAAQDAIAEPSARFAARRLR